MRLGEEEGTGKAGLEERLGNMQIGFSFQLRNITSHMILTNSLVSLDLNFLLCNRTESIIVPASLGCHENEMIYMKA